MAYAIKAMQVRGAGLIGATAGYGMYIAALNAPRHSREAFLSALQADGEALKATRPTAINLEWAVHRQMDAIRAGQTIDDMIEIARRTGQAIADEDADFCRRIGEHGVSLIEDDQPAQKWRAGQHPDPL